MSNGRGDANFTASTIRKLAERAAYQCSVPWCETITVGPGSDDDNTANSGTGCHIYSAADSGPRGNGGHSDAFRKSIQNGIWCCATHGRLIDTNDGGRFPAETLFAWKKLHEARIDRKRSSIYTKCGWIERIRVLNSFLFDVPIDCELGKGTVLQGEMGTGKTALSQWVATLRTRRYVRRWQTFRPFSETRLAIRYHTQEAIRLAEIRILKDTVEFYLDGTIQFQPPEDIAIVSFPERWYEQLHETHSSVEFMQKLFEIDRPQLSSLCAEIERSGGASARNFRLDQDEDGYWQLRGSLEGTVPNLSFFQWSTSEQIRALVELSMSLARLLAVSKPTLLVLDSGGWNWSDPLYDCYSEYLGRQPFQTLFIMNLGRPTSSPQWNQWRSYELVGAWRSGRPSRLKKLNNETGET